MLGLALGELTRLTENISDVELATAKNTLKLRCLMGLERQADRMAETLQNLRVSFLLVMTKDLWESLPS
jgi:hypothetical protein